jgi:hypothetical protein
MTANIGTITPRISAATAKIALAIFPGIAKLYDLGYRHCAQDLLALPAEERYRVLEQVPFLGP